MKNNITRNVTLNPNEKILKDFRRLRAKGCLAQVMLTTKRLIIYTNGLSLIRGRKVERKMMNEIELKSIHRFEYSIDSLKNRILVRLFGLILFVGAAYLVYLNYLGTLPIPAYPYSNYLNYVGLLLVMFIGLLMMFLIRKTLSLRIKSGLEEKTVLAFKANKYNELMLRYLAGKIHVN